MLQITPQMKILVAVDAVAFRKGIDGLVQVCKQSLQQDPFTGAVFVFRNRRGTALKALVYDELIRHAAQGDVVHNDDTTVKILKLMGARAKQRALAEQAADHDADKNVAENKTQQHPAQPPTSRSGLFTSGVVATREGRRVVLFFSGRQHAGENLADVLRRRSEEFQQPIQMCDALSRNLTGDLKTIVANCLAHARRQFVDVYDRFSDECRCVLEALKVVYRSDAEARRQRLSPEQRLQFHQTHSRPAMDRLHCWLNRQFDEKLVEPNSAQGGAIRYMLKHWEKLTLFLRAPGAPLDNNRPRPMAVVDYFGWFSTEHVKSPFVPDPAPKRPH